MSELLPHNPISASESQSRYDGPLSTYREWHALLFGVVVGALFGWSRTLRSDARHEPHYVLAGALGAALAAIRLRG